MTYKTYDEALLALKRWQQKTGKQGLIYALSDNQYKIISVS